MKKIKVSVLVAIVLMCSSSSLATIDMTTFGFECITNNNSSDAANGENSLFVDVNSMGDTGTL